MEKCYDEGIRDFIGDYLFTIYQILLIHFTKRKNMKIRDYF